MIVYWDLLAMWNLAIDYFLLFAASKLAGVHISRKRLLAAAAFGALCAVALLFLPRSFFALVLSFLLLCALGFYGTGRGVRTSLLFLILCCAFAGFALLLAHTPRLRRGMFLADLPWGVFFLAGGICHLLLCVIFRGGARRQEGDFLRATLRHRGREVTLRFLRDTGNTLRDGGNSVPVVERTALRGFSPEETEPIAYAAVGVSKGEMESFLCDEVIVEGRSLGRRRIALSPTPFGGEFQGLWGGED